MKNPLVWKFVLLIAALSLLGFSCTPQPLSPPTEPVAEPRAAPEPRAPTPSTPSASFEEKQIDLGSVSGAPKAFANVSPAVPSTWDVEVVPSIEAINLYDPAAPGTSPREQSQIFLRHFSANDFLTLSTVIIHEREHTTVVGRPAVRYVIEKRAGVPDFPAQPPWRNTRHTVVDVRLADTNPSTFMVIGKRPDVPDEVFARFLTSLRIGERVSVVVYPVRGFASAITKKPFGLFVRPGQSPVDPERFIGYHTAADAELPADTPVFSIAGGTVLRSGRVSGYGGLIVIEHQIHERIVSLYGHLDPTDLPRVGKVVAAGERIGKLGDGFTDETDGERPHLHFGLSVGSGIDVHGYVPAEQDLTVWRDPVRFLAEKNAREP